jgi:hypothetical protein
MKWRLDAPHYINDMYLESGTEIGDDTGIPFRFERDSNTVRPDGKRVVVKKGERMLPSIAMTPLDDEAKKVYQERYGEVPPDVDPTQRIPIMGNVQSSENIQPGKSPIPGAIGPTADPNAGKAGTATTPKPAAPGKAEPDARPKVGETPTPGAPDNRSTGAAIPSTASAPPSPAPSGPGSGRSEEENKKMGNPNPDAATEKEKK